MTTATATKPVTETTIVSNEDYVKAFTTKFKRHLKTGKPFSANSFLEMKQRPYEPNLIGSLWAKLIAKFSKEIRVVAHDRSKNPRSKGRRINVYTGVKTA